MQIFSPSPMDLTENQKKDKEKFYLHSPDPDFDPEKAKDTIARTIRKTDARRLKKGKDAMEALDERSVAVASYLKSLSNGKVKSVESYFGKKELARLQGQKILQKLKWINGKRVITFEEL